MINNAEEYLHRAGVIAERAFREKRSLTKEERTIIIAGRDMSSRKGMWWSEARRLENEGAFDREAVLQKIKVKAVFSYYEFGVPQYFIIESNHPALAQGGNVSAEDLRNADQKVPKTPTCKRWVKKGSPCYRKKSWRRTLLDLF